MLFVISGFISSSHINDWPEFCPLISGPSGQYCEEGGTTGSSERVEGLGENISGGFQSLMPAIS